jgi:23S rRNA (guanine745-N1)-methyltransferase
MVAFDPAEEQRLHRALDPFFGAAVTEQVAYSVP